MESTIIKEGADHPRYSSQRLLGNILLHPPADIRLTTDPETAFLRDSSGFIIFICAVSYEAAANQSMSQIASNQERAYALLKQVLMDQFSEKYIRLVEEIENRLVAMFVPRDFHKIRTGEFGALLQRALQSSLSVLDETEHIPLQLVYGVQRDLTKINQTYAQLKNAVIFLDYMERTPGQLLPVEELSPKEHIDLWNHMEESNDRFVQAFLHNHPEDAISCMNSMIDTIASWVPLSKDSLLSDVQYYFDSVLTRLSQQFGADVIQGIEPAGAIFNSASASILRSELAEIIMQLFSRVRRNTSDSTFDRMTEICRYIDENLTAYSLSASTIAAHFQMSPQLLSMQFKKCMGCTPLQYIEQHRVELIKNYLIHSTMPVEAICPLVGIGTVSTLHRIFKKHVGQTTGVYRKAFQEITAR